MSKSDKFLQLIKIKNLQRYVDKVYEKEGLTEEVLVKQAEINSLRHEYDVSDESKRVFGKFVQ